LADDVIFLLADVQNDLEVFFLVCCPESLSGFIERKPLGDKREDVNDFIF